MKKLFIFTFFLLMLPAFTKAQYHIYGSTAAGGIYGDGVIFSYNPFTNKDSVIFSFNGIDGSYPQSDFLIASNGLLYSLTEFGGKNNMGTIFSFNLKNSSENVLVSLDSINGEIVDGGNDLVQGKNGKLYGTIYQGGMYNAGVLFSYDINTGIDSVLFNFGSDSSAWPCRSLYQDTVSGVFYGTTESGGRYNRGVLYKFDPNTLTDSILVNFGSVNSQPLISLSGLMRASNGLLYSLAAEGGDSNFGVIYSYDIITRSLKTEFSFNGKNGQYPWSNTLIQLLNGLMYGMTTNGGTNNDGVLFEFNPTNDSEKVLFNFDGANGDVPEGGLLWDPYNSLLYGMTYMGGSNGEGVFFSYDTVTSTYTKIFDFTGTNGAYPLNSLIIVKDSSVETGVNKINESGGVRVYPNPSGGVFKIQINNGQWTMKCNVEIYNVLGEKVYTSTLLPQTPKGALKEINLSSQANGVYFYRVIKEDGGLVGSGKVIIEK